MLKKNIPMFETARLKLTAWYVLIIMLVSFTFTAFIFNGVSREFQARLENIERRFSTETPQGFKIHGKVHQYFVKDLETAKNRVIIILLYANGFLFIVSTTFGNYLAGKALQPIKDSLDEQKRFVADASHELKTPITSLQTSIEVALRDKKLNLKDAKKTLRESLHDIENLKLLTNELLALARLTDNGIEKKEVDIKEVSEKIFESFKKIAEMKKIKLTKRLVKTMINADRVKLEKLITILLDNAIKYTPKSGEVHLAVRPSINRNSVTVLVKDTGVGISKKEKVKIFDRFYRSDTSRSKLNVEGFGLGLSIAKKIVDRHEGNIRVKSKVGEGSTFIVTLPL